MSIFKRSKSKSPEEKEEKKEENTELKPTAFKSVRLDILKRPGASEKAMRLREKNQYLFIVKPSANKKMVKEEIERRYGVKVKDVNVIKNKKDSDKKAVVTLAAGQKIDL